jgi:hypothetical protein
MLLPEMSAQWAGEALSSMETTGLPGQDAQLLGI